MTDFLLKQILKQYNIKNYISFTKVKKGITSNNYIVKTKNKNFFLKQHRPGVINIINDIEKAEQFFISKSIPVVDPIRTKGSHLHYTKDNICYVLYPFVKGKAYPINKTPKKIFSEMGKVLAEIHLLTKDNKISKLYKQNTYFQVPNKQKTLSKFNSLLNYIVIKSDFDSFVVKSLQMKKRMVTKLKVKGNLLVPKDRHMCLGDYYQDNIFFNQEGKVSYIFDLDMAGPAPRIYELIRSCMLSCFWYSINLKTINNAAIFINAYYKKYPFTKKEFKSALELYYTKSYFSTWMESDHYENNDKRTDLIYRTTVEMIKYLSKNRSKLVDLLYKTIKK